MLLFFSKTFSGLESTLRVLTHSDEKFYEICKPTLDVREHLILVRQIILRINIIFMPYGFFLSSVITAVSLTLFSSNKFDFCIIKEEHNHVTDRS
jgi:hypothetical protein